MGLNLRYMQLADIRQVAAIDVICFEPPWSYESYTFEITESERQPYGRPGAAVGRGASTTSTGVNRCELVCATSCAAIRRQHYSTGEILGYGGLWKVDGEAHISTIAIHPANRGLGYGEILLAGMFGKALQLDAEYHRARSAREQFRGAETL